MRTVPPGEKTFADAVPISAAQYLAAVKEVSVTVAASKKVTRYVPLSDLKRWVTDCLAFWRPANRREKLTGWGHR